MRKNTETEKNRTSGGQNLTATILLLALAVIVILGASYATVLLMEQNSYDAGENIVSDVVGRIDSKTGDVEALTRETAQTAETLIADPKALEQLVHDFVSRNESVMGSTIAFEPDAFPEYGRCFAPYSWRDSTEEIRDRQLGEETDYYQEEWYAEAKAGGSEYWCEPYFDEGGAKIMMCTFSVPIKDGSGSIVAVLTADVGLDDLDDYIASINPYPDSDIYLFSAKGSVLADDEKHQGDTQRTVIVKRDTKIGWFVELVLPITYLLHGNVNVFVIIGAILLVSISLVLVVYNILRKIRDRANEERLEQARVSLDKEKVFRTVMMDEVSGFLQANLSRNRIEVIASDISSTKEWIGTDPAMISENSGYDEFEKWWSENRLLSDPVEFLKVSNRAYLISRFESGEKKVSVLCTSKDEKGDPKIIRQEYYLYQDAASGDINTFCIVWDITEEKEIERKLEEALSSAQSANEAKSNFLFNMSHDIRTPMNAIIGYTSMAKKHSNDPQVNDYLEKIDVSGKQLLSLVNQVLEMSRIESGKITLAEEPVNLAELAKSLETIVAADISQKGITYTVDSGNLVHKDVLTDVSRTNQIIVNIVGNAVKYTPEGGSIRCSIEEKPCDKEGYGLYVTKISDTGIGMSEEYQKHIFEEFTRENSSTVSKIQGTGLGMSIVKKLVDLMGGTIGVESRLGEGTTITLSVPLKWNTDAVAPAADALEPAEISLKGMHVLLVEDNEMNREIATEILEDEGVIVETAEDGDIALDIIKALAKKGNYGYYDAVLMDIQMPRMNGYEATRAIREIPVPTGIHLPIIALSANAFEEDRQKSLDAGMDDHVAKPIDIWKLKETLARFL